MKKRIFPCVLCLVLTLAFGLSIGCVEKKEVSLSDIPAQEALPESTATPAPTEAPTPEPTEEPTPAPTPAVNLDHFPFLETTLKLDLITDDPEAEGAEALAGYAKDHKAEGRFVLLVLSAVDDELPLEQIKEYYAYVALTGGGNGYTAIGFNVMNIAYNAEKNTFEQSAMQKGYRIVFDIPAELALTDLQLEVVNDEAVRLPIQDWSGFAGGAQPAPAASDAEKPGTADETGVEEVAFDAAAAVSYVKSSESLDGLKPACKVSAIRGKLGPEDDFPLINMDTMQLFYMGKGYIFTYLNASKVVTNVCAYPPAAGLTAKGVGVGSTADEVKAAYAGMIDPALSDETKLYVGDQSAYLEFILKEGTVNMINLGF